MYILKMDIYSSYKNIIEHKIRLYERLSQDISLDNTYYIERKLLGALLEEINHSDIVDDNKHQEFLNNAKSIFYKLKSQVEHEPICFTIEKEIIYAMNLYASYILSKIFNLTIDGVSSDRIRQNINEYLNPNYWSHLIMEDTKKVIDRHLKDKKPYLRNPLTKSIKFEVLKKDNYKCVCCGATKDDCRLEIDHIIPVSQGGSDELDNLQTLCKDCNLAKSNRIINIEK